MLYVNLCWYYYFCAYHPTSIVQHELQRWSLINTPDRRKPRKVKETYPPTKPIATPFRAYFRLNSYLFRLLSSFLPSRTRVLNAIVVFGYSLLMSKPFADGQTTVLDIAVFRWIYMIAPRHHRHHAISVRAVEVWYLECVPTTYCMCLLYAEEVEDLATLPSIARQRVNCSISIRSETEPTSHGFPMKNNFITLLILI